MSVARLYENDIILITTYFLKNNGKNEVAVWTKWKELIMNLGYKNFHNLFSQLPRWYVVISFIEEVLEVNPFESDVAPNTTY